MKNAILYRAVPPLWLMPGSEAHKLHTEGKLKKLEEHMKAVLAFANKQEGR